MQFLKGKPFRLILATTLLLLPQWAAANRPPGYLADISLSELLEIRVENSDDDAEHDQVHTLDSLTSPSRFALWHRYKEVRFEGYKDGTNALSNTEVLQQFPVLPTVIDQEAHIFGLNYRHSNRLDFTISIPHLYQSTQHIRRSGGPFTLKSDGFGDLSVTGNYAAIRYGTTAVVISAGITAPTGTIDAKGDTPRGKNTQLPYAMQIGSGSWALNPGITYATAKGLWGLGATLGAVVHLDENKRHYTLGDQKSLTLWTDRELNSRVKFGAHLRAEAWGDIDGQDPDVNPLTAPVAYPGAYGGSQIKVGGSMRFDWNDDLYDNSFIEFRAAAPIWQNLNGPQPEQKWEFTIGISYGL